MIIMRKTFILFSLALIIGLITTVTSYAQTEMLTGGNMETESDWNISLLNTETGAEPTATWNYTTSGPTAGVGGNLHATGTTNTGNTQYCIYQEVVLSNTKSYTFDGAFHALQINNSWCEVFIGTKPIDGKDYGEGMFRFAAFGTWAGYTSDDGVFSVDIDPNNYNVFVPDTNGTYYFVLKMGSTSWDGTDKTFEIIVDEFSLIEDGKPVVDFFADVTNGIAPLDVVFTDASKFATSWAWNFGDGNSSTEQNPTHNYTSAGTYSVTLEATNTDGTTELVKTDYITVNPAVTLEAGGVIEGGEMSDGSAWSINYLNTATGNEPTLTWDDIIHTPSAGQDGALYIEGDAPGGQNAQVAIYQAVTLSTDSIYYFDAAFKDFDNDLQNTWAEAYVGSEPVTGEDYNSGETRFLLSDLTTWSGDCNPAGLDGTFSLSSCNYNGFIPDSNGTYYFVVRIGSWEGGDFQIAIDELSLKAYRLKPITAFSADMPTGFVPLTVNFNDKSVFAESWAWDFGDGSSSTEQNPTHTYDIIGQYTVSLTTTNEIGDSTITKTNYITVNDKPALPAGEKLYGGNMENPNFWTITNLNASAIPTATWNYTDDSPTGGVGGNLHVTGTVNNTTSHYCIWQPVELKADSIYTFEGVFKDITGIDHFWCEVFIGTEAPVDGADYGEGVDKIVHINTWDGSAQMIDGAFSEIAITDENPYQPESDGTYYFIVKLGNTDWEGTDYSFDVILDELTLVESTPVVLPVPSFFADVTSGDAYLTVQFYNESTDAIEYSWDFGDGGTSTDKSPSHTYTAAGKYSVSLTASSENYDSTIVKTDLITVSEPANGLTSLGANQFRVYPNPANDVLHIETKVSDNYSVAIYNIVGVKVYEESQLGKNKEIDISTLTNGIYLISLRIDQDEILKKIIIE